MIMVGTCAFCGRSFEAKGRDAKVCSDLCRAKQTARNKRLAAAGAIPAITPIPNPSPGQPTAANEVVDVGLSTETARALRQADRLNTPLGAVCMVIARRLDHDSMLDTGSGLAALTRELTRLLDLALQGGQTEPDELDELERRRREKAARSGP
jgi:hypothetical protein